MSELGIYLGPEIISIVETRGKKLIKNIQILRREIATGDLEEKIPEDVKMVTFLGDQMRKHNITAGEVSLALSGKDLIIRTFEMPVMFREDLFRAINFEAKKYIPFKTEELILDYRVYFDKTNRKNMVLLVGIKKETLDKYLSVFQQLNLKVVSLEYAAFSALRLLKLTGVKTKGVVGIIEVDLRELDEINFMVLENGFPLFSRDIILMGGPQESEITEEIGPEKILEKFKTEARISLDYYHRKFPAVRKIDKTIFIASRDYESDLEAVAQDIGLGDIQLIEVEKYIGKSLSFSLGFFKGYGASLSKTLEMASGVDLISAKEKQAKEAAAPTRRHREASVMDDLRPEFPVIVLSLMVCLAPFLFGLYHKLPLKREIDSIKAARPQVATVNPDSSYEDLNGVDSEYKRKLANLDRLIRKQLYLTSPLSVIPATIPEGVWLKDFVFLNKLEENKSELILQGAAYFADSDKEIESVNRFVSNLKGDPEFIGHFKDISIVSIGQERFGKLTVTNFSISCKN